MEWVTLKLGGVSAIPSMDIRIDYGLSFKPNLKHITQKASIAAKALTPSVRHNAYKGNILAAYNLYAFRTTFDNAALSTLSPWYQTISRAHTQFT